MLQILILINLHILINSFNVSKISNNKYLFLNYYFVKVSIINIKS